MLRMVLLVACASAIAGCATVTRGPQGVLAFQSEPPGAEVRTIRVETPCGDQPCPREADERQAAPIVETPPPNCVTPCQATVDRLNKFTVTISKPGYHTETVRITTRQAAAGTAGMLGNVLIGGATGVMMDTATGATLEHDPNPVVVNLRPVAALPPSRRR